MVELEKDYSPENIDEIAQESFTPLFNLTRINSTPGEMIFSADNKIYYFFENPAVKMVKRHWCIDIAEIASYGKTGLAGFKIVLKDGTTLRFSNVFRKMREGIIAAIEERKQ